MIISWGKPTITVTPIDDTNAVISAAVELPTPVEDSTELTSEKGDKLEAPIEGGANEAVKYKKNTYSVELQIRHAQGRTLELDGSDGVITGEYTLKIDPEDVGAPNVTMQRCVISYEDSYTAADGLIRTYTFDSLEPEDGTNQLVFGNKSEATE